MDVITLTKALIKINTVSSDNGKTVLSIIDQVLGGLPYRKEEYIFNEVVNAFYYPSYDCAELFTFNGHYDVVPAQDWQSAFEPEENDGFLYGRGAADMKSGLAAMTIAFADLLREKSCAALLIVGDEEQGGSNGTAAILEEILKKHNIKRALIGEPMQEARFLGDVVKIGRRGTLWLKIAVQGEGGHASQHLSHNPSQYINHLLSIEKKLNNKDLMAPTTINITSISMPLSAYNIVPSHLEVTLDIRMNYGTTKTEILNLLQKDGYKIEIEELFYAAPFFNPDQDYTNATINFLRSKGYNPQPSTAGGSSDARFFASEGIGVIEFGPCGFNAHGENEHVSISELRILPSLYKGIARLN